MQDFTHIYHLDLHGNVRKNPKLSGTTHNVFGIQVGVGITVAVRASRASNRGAYYARVPETWRREQKTSFLSDSVSTKGVSWQELQPDARNTWLTQGFAPEFDGFLPIGTKDAKAGGHLEEAICSTYCLGVSTNRDSVVYDFDRSNLESRALQFIEDYNAEVSRWIRAGRPEDVDSFVHYDKLKWSEMLKVKLRRGVGTRFDVSEIRHATYRPFTRRWLYYDRVLIDAYALYASVLPNKSIGNEIICLTGYTSEKPFMVLNTSLLPDLHLVGAGAGAMCFPLYTYDEDGSNRRENVTDWALGQFRARYGEDVTKRDIFDYVYGLLHHPTYRERYAENLKRELPRIPLLPTRAEFEATRETGAALAALHLGYETAKEYPLNWRFTPDTQQNWRVKKMKLAQEKTAVVYNEWLTLEGVPQEAFEYRLGNRSALEWVIDQYQVSTDTRSGIVSDPNRTGSDEEKQYITRLVGRVVTVSVETVRLVRALAARVDLLAAVGVTRE